ncbi:MAG: sulfite exporter TauE/SafE family protein [Pseudomonadota bacterium]
MSHHEILYALTVLLLAYFVRGISGFGSGLIAVPLLALQFPLTQVVPFMLMADFSASALIGGLHFRHVDKAEVVRLLPVSLVGIVLGTTLLVSLPTTALLATLAGFILLFALRFLLARPGPFTPISPRWAWPAALSGGAVGALFGTGGPPYVIYLSHRIQDKTLLRATLSGLFFMEGLMRIVAFLVAGLLLDPDIWLYLLLAFPVILAALYGGSHIHTRLSNAQMQRLVGWLLLVSALSVAAKALQSG